MSVIVKGLKMPENCMECMLSDLRAAIKCTEWTEISAGRRENERAMFCPLIELPEKHGNLIDIDSKIEVQFFDEQEDEWSLKTVTVGDYLCYASEIPGAVVEADGDEE